MRRFSFVLKWSSIVVLVSSFVLRLPLLVAYFRNVPNVLDYLPIARVLMSGLIIAFCSVQISLALHNETLIEAVKSGAVKKNAGADENTAEIVYWEPISPYITKADFVR